MGRRGGGVPAALPGDGRPTSARCTSASRSCIGLFLCSILRRFLARGRRVHSRSLLCRNIPSRSRRSLRLPRGIRISRLLWPGSHRRNRETQPKRNRYPESKSHKSDNRDCFSPVIGTQGTARTPTDRISIAAFNAILCERLYRRGWSFLGRRRNVSPDSRFRGGTRFTMRKLLGATSPVREDSQPPRRSPWPQRRI